MVIAILLLVSGTYSALAGLQFTELVHESIDGHKVVKIANYQDLNLNEVCFKSKTPQCQALQFSQAKAPGESVFKSTNPSVDLCKYLSGKTILLTQNKYKNFNYCLFADGSMVDSWQLLKKVTSKKVN